MHIINFLTIILLFPLSSISFFSENELSFKEFEKYKVKEEKLELDNLLIDEIDHLRESLLDNSTEIQELSHRLDDCFLELDILKANEIRFNCKELSKVFDKLNTESGSFFIHIKEVKPYLNGYKIILHIGNPNLVTYINPEINLTWNFSINKYLEFTSKILEKQKDSKEKIFMPAWEDTLKTKNYCVMKRLLPGVWNEIEIDIPDVTLDQLEDCTLSLKIGTVILSKDTRIK